MHSVVFILCLGFPFGMAIDPMEKNVRKSLQDNHKSIDAQSESVVVLAGGETTLTKKKVHEMSEVALKNKKGDSLPKNKAALTEKVRTSTALTEKEKASAALFAKAGAGAQVMDSTTQQTLAGKILPKVGDATKGLDPSGKQKGKVGGGGTKKTTSPTPYVKQKPGKCFSSSTRLLSSDGRSSHPIKELRTGTELRVLPLSSDGESLVAKKKSGLFVGWAHYDDVVQSDFKEFVVAGCSVRVTPEHYMAVKDSIDTQEKFVAAENVSGNALLPVWNEITKTVTWEAIQSSQTVQEVGIYSPLLTESPLLVTHCGIVAPVLGHSENYNATKMGEIYKIWMKNVAGILSNYPCLIEFDPAFHKMKVIQLMETFFEKHPHLEENASHPEEFLLHLKDSPEEMVGQNFSYVTEHCADLKTISEKGKAFMNELNPLKVVPECMSKTSQALQFCCVKHCVAQATVLSGTVNVNCMKGCLQKQQFTEENKFVNKREPPILPTTKIAKWSNKATQQAAKAAKRMGEVSKWTKKISESVTDEWTR